MRPFALCTKIQIGLTVGQKRRLFLRKEKGLVATTGPLVVWKLIYQIQRENIYVHIYNKGRLYGRVATSGNAIYG